MNPLSATITKFQPQHTGSNLILIRHGQTYFNKAITELERYKYILDSEEYKRKLAEIRFSKSYIDTELTAKGKEEAVNSGTQMEGLNIRNIIVSPMIRTLQTCENIIKSFPSDQSKINVIVHPALFEKIEDSCDLEKSLTKAMKMFPHYNWDLFKGINYPSIFQLKDCDTFPLNYNEMNNYYEHAIQQLPLYPNDSIERLHFILEAMSKLGEEGKYIESSVNTIKRLFVMKKFLLDMIQSIQKEDEDEKVLIVGHSICLQHLTANYLSENMLEPKEGSFILKNCEQVYINFD
jgi:broad specificity phosphatase PhoE